MRDEDWRQSRTDIGLRRKFAERPRGSTEDSAKNVDVAIATLLRRRCGDGRLAPRKVPHVDGAVPFDDRLYSGGLFVELADPGVTVNPVGHPDQPSAVRTGRPAPHSPSRWSADRTRA